MIKFVILLVLVTVLSEGCRSQVPKQEVEKKNSTATLPIPYPKYQRIIDPATVVVRWDPVKVSEDNPILGFKVKLWEDQKKKVFKYVMVDGEEKLIEELVPIKKSFHVLPTHRPAFIAVVPPDVFQATFHVKLGEHYELRAQTFNADGDGPLSNTYGFRIHNDNSTEGKD